MNSTIIMRCLEKAGRIIMENGGETYRVEDTVIRMGHSFGLPTVEVFAVPSGIFLSFTHEDGRSESSVLRTRDRGRNLTRIDEVNAISRRCVAEKLSPEEVWGLLCELQTRKPLLNNWHLVLAAAVSSAGFAIMFGGFAIEAAIAFMTAGLVQMMSMLPQRFQINNLTSAMIGSFLSTILPLSFCHLTGLGTVDPIIAGALMPLLPGLAMTYSILDILHGDMISSLSHAMQAVMIAIFVAGGALIATNLWYAIGGMPV